MILEVPSKLTILWSISLPWLLDIASDFQTVNLVVTEIFKLLGVSSRWCGVATYLPSCFCCLAGGLLGGERQEQGQHCTNTPVRALYQHGFTSWLEQQLTRGQVSDGTLPHHLLQTWVMMQIRLKSDSGDMGVTLLDLFQVQWTFVLYHTERYKKCDLKLLNSNVFK